MTVATVLAALLLPPMLFVPVGLAGVLLAWRGWRPGLAVTALAGLAQLLLATPLAARWLVVSLDPEPGGAAAGDAAPAAIIILGAEAVPTPTGSEVGPLTLERLRAGAALHRATGLPILTTGGPPRAGQAPLAALMAASLAADFGVAVRWIEPRAGDTRDNAAFGAMLLRDAGIGAAHLVTHGWHMPRAVEAFARQELAVRPAPVRRDPPPRGEAGDWLPRADRWGQSWFAIREQAGRLVYALRD